jgi:hypothetical protein
MTSSEVQSVEKVLLSPIEGIRKHFITALQFLRDRKNPNYRNSVKESISAVETACKHPTGFEKATLGDALNKLHNKRPLHQAFKDALAVRLDQWSPVRHSSTTFSNDKFFDRLKAALFPRTMKPNSPPEPLYTFRYPELGYSILIVPHT